MKFNLKNWYKNTILTNSNKKWRLYNSIPKLEIQYTFAFIDQLATLGHFNSQLIKDGKEWFHKAIINVNLHKKINKKTIIHIINHENLHIAICNCLKNTGNIFIETVIEQWLLKTKIIRNGNRGDILIEKVFKRKK